MLARKSKGGVTDKTWSSDKDGAEEDGNSRGDKKRAVEAVGEQ